MVESSVPQLYDYVDLDYFIGNKFEGKKTSSLKRWWTIGSEIHGQNYIQNHIIDFSIFLLKLFYFLAD